MNVGTTFDFKDARGLLSEAKFYEGYSRFLPELNRYESWTEAVNRVMNMHRKFFTDKGKMTPALEKLINDAQLGYEKQEFLGAQRALQFGGDQLLKHHSKMYNCIGTPVDRVVAFGEIFYWLLSGCGVGFSVQNRHISKLPRVVPRLKQAKIHVIEDSIEGWSESLDVLLSSFFEGGGKHPEFSGRKIYFDSTKIREKGALIAGHFLAPGPEPLMKALNKIENILINASNEKRQLKSIEIYDILMHTADAVLAGGVRRSATICFFSFDDNDMMTAKTGNWLSENPQRGRSNNTVMLKRDEVTFEEFESIISKTKEFGEPGFYFTDDYDILSNPCVEIGFYPYHEGESGSQGCNLVEINGGACKTEEAFYSACRNAAIVGTLQAAYTDFKFVSETTKKIFEREALLGVSITGWMESPDILLNEDNLRIGVDIIRETNKEVAELIGINQAARLTCTKPSGNASVLLRTSSGIHGHHDYQYIRNVQMNKDSKVAQTIKNIYPALVEESLWSTNKTDYVISFPVVVDKKAICKNDLLGVKFLEKVKFVQENWVEYGTNKELCTHPKVRHNVSNTCVVDDWDEVVQYIFDNRNHLTGVSLLSISGDKDYVQAPNTSVYYPIALNRMYGIGYVFGSGLIVDAMHSYGSLWKATDYVKYNTIIEEDTPNRALMIDWIRRFKKFSKNYFRNDLTAAEYCLKDIHNLHKWMKIQSVLSEGKFNINWNEHLRDESLIDIDTMGAQACAGGTCEI